MIKSKPTGNPRRILLALLLSSTAFVFNSLADVTYVSEVLADAPLVYYRLNEAGPATPDVATNRGTLGAAANGVHHVGVIHPVPGAIVGSANTAAKFTAVDPVSCDGGSPTVVLWPESPLIRELWDNVGVGEINGLVNGTSSVGFNAGASWQANKNGIRVAQDFDVATGAPDALSGPPVNRGQKAGLWTAVAGWDTSVWATRQLTAGAQIDFGADGVYWITVRINNTGDTAMGVGLASGGDGSASFVGLGAMWNTAGGGAANNAIYVSDGTLGTDTPYVIRAHSSAGAIDGRGLIIARLTTSAGGPDTLEAVVLQPGDVVPPEGGISWQVTHAFNSSMVASHLVVWLNGMGTGELDAIRVTTSYDAMFVGSGLNTAGSFTVEAWLKPEIDGLGNAQCPMINRYINPSTGNRYGWDFFQRSSGTGWNFRMFNGTSASSSVFNITGGAYEVGSWCHLVAVYDASVPSATLYLNGVQVAQSTTPNGTYAPNTVAPLAIGSFPNQLSGNGYENPLIGAIDEFAIYTNALSAAQVLAHYQNGLDAGRTTEYDALVLSGSPVVYYRMDEPAHDLAVNDGSLGDAATGIYSATPAAVNGTRPPTYAGFDSGNLACDFTGSGYVELGNPPELNFSGLGGTLTLEAWILPRASQGFESYVVAHGGNDNWSGEVFLRIENGNYEVGSNNGKASAAAPSGDLGGANWVHLVGTYDGFYWTLYRNGAQIAQATDFMGPNPVPNGNWAIGARGRWKTFKDTLDRQFNGHIDEVAIYNVALPLERVQAHFYAGKFADLNPAPVITQQPQSQGRFLGSTVTFTVVAEGAAPLSYQWFKDGSPVGTDSPTLTLYNLQAGDAGDYSVTVTGMAGSADSDEATLTVLASEYGSIICMDQPAAYYPLDETSGGTAYDQFSGAYNGSYQWPGSSVTLGIPGPSANISKAARFNAAGRVWIGNPSALNQPGQITLEAWIRPTHTSGDQYIISHGLDWANWKEIVLRIENGVYQVGAWYYDGSSWQGHASMNVPASDLNTWVHIAGTYDGSTWRLYHNGELAASMVTGGPVSLSEAWAIGGAGSTERWFDGGICQAAIYTIALTDDQIRKHFAAGTPNPLSIANAGGVIEITWPAGTLQVADDVAGPYVDVPEATSPYQPPTDGTNKFYRLRF